MDVIVIKLNQSVNQSSSLNILLNFPNFFFFLPGISVTALISTSANPVAVNRLAPRSGLESFPFPFPFAIPIPSFSTPALSAEKGRSSSPTAALGGESGRGQDELFSRLIVRRFWSLGEVGRSARSCWRSDLLLSSGVSLLAGDSASDFRTLDAGSGFFRRRIDMKLPRRL